MKPNVIDTELDVFGLVWREAGIVFKETTEDVLGPFVRWLAAKL